MRIGEYDAIIDGLPSRAVVVRAQAAPAAVTQPADAQSGSSGPNLVAAAFLLLATNQPAATRLKKRDQSEVPERFRAA
jgi:hypothetical protein